MERFDPTKLYVKFRPGVTLAEPIIRRRYTLIRPDMTEGLSLTIGKIYDSDSMDTIENEFLFEWIWKNGQYFLNSYLSIDGELGPGASSERYEAYRRELPLALKAIRHGDAKLFEAHGELDYVPIIVYFISSISHQNRVENWGVPLEYI